jgi:translation elongation factor EF-1alpha
LESRFGYIKEKLKTYLENSNWDLNNINFIPISGYLGSNIVKKYEDCQTWYKGDS